MNFADQIDAVVRPIADAADAQIAHLTARVAEEAAGRLANHLGAQDARQKRDLALAQLATCTSARESLSLELIQAHTQVSNLQTSLSASQATIVLLEARIAELEATGSSAFSLGVTKPTVETSGSRIPYAQLAHYPVRVTSTHPVTGQPLQRGDVISGVRVAGFKITVPGVIVRDCWVDGVGLDYTPSSSANHYLVLVDCRDSGTGGATSDSDMVRFEHVTVIPAQKSYLNVGFQGSNFVAFRCLVRNVTDAFAPHSSSTQSPRAVDILGCYMDDFYIDTEPAGNQSDLITHNDAIQGLGRLRRLRIEGNAVGGYGNTVIGSVARPRTSNVLLQTKAGQYTGEGVIISRNWFKGHQSVGSTLNLPTQLNCTLVITDNEFAADAKSPAFLIDSAMRSAQDTTISGNVLDTGAPVPINNA